MRFGSLFYIFCPTQKKKFRLLGAERIVRVGLGEAQATVEKIAQELQTKEGRHVYIIPGGASNEIGATGYCACAAEIQVSAFTFIAVNHPLFVNGKVSCC